MNSKRFRFNNHRSWVIGLVLAITPLALTAIPALASDDPGQPADRPVICCVVSDNQGTYSDDCFRPGQFPRFPVIMMQRPVPSQIGGAPMINKPDHQPGKILVESPRSW